MNPALAIVGMACRYPDADSPEALWENVLAQRRAFRRIPPERLRLEDYASADRAAPDRTYATQAAVIEGYAFDRVHFRVSGSTYRQADLAHWLALDIATRALADAGFYEGEGLPLDETGVIVGNTLTGEFSRANVMRLRWPYVRRVVDRALADDGWSTDARRSFLEQLEGRYKDPFPPVGTETLAGGLSNTIAGRICNHYDLKGGGYTVDGACAASLLAVIHACSAVASGDLEVALAGGVDLSLDPFELIGFAKTGALASDRMRVYDARSDGFWPGEGCGFVVLMRHNEAIRQGRRVYAVLRGWGVSSDGCGGITRPEVAGQSLAVTRAYRRAGYGIESVALFEGHGTGTAVGDTVELQTLAQARRAADPDAPPATIGTVKANIGHTKAAAGVAGLIKASLALYHQVLPPTTGCETPHAELTGPAPALRVLPDGRPWPADAPLRAGVSAMGFGGINTHVTLENTATRRHGAFSPHERLLLSTRQDAELFVLGARDAAALHDLVDRLAARAPRLAQAELADLAAHLAATTGTPVVRAAVVAATPAELATHLDTLAGWLAAGVTRRLETVVTLGTAAAPPRIGLLFPGQGSPAHLDGGAWRQRYETVRALYGAHPFAPTADDVATDVAQPAIVTASLGGLRVLSTLGLDAVVGVGHSLGELTALHWAGALDAGALTDLATARGRAMADLDAPTGAMASLAAAPDAVAPLLDRRPVGVAGRNGPHQTVISGPEDAVVAVLEDARRRGLDGRRLHVSHAFHSPLVAAAAEPLAAHLDGIAWQPLRRRVVSTVTGMPLSDDQDLPALLRQQVTNPVRFTEAAAIADRDVDLWIEVGPGHVLAGLVQSFLDTPVVALDAGGASLRGLLQGVGTAFTLGAPVRVGALFVDRFTRPFSLNVEPRFFTNPCELAPATDPETRPEDSAAPVVAPNALPTNGTPPASTPAAPLDLLRRLVAQRAELPEEAVRDDDRLLSDLHLNSITVSELLVKAARHLHLAPSAAPTQYADVTLADVAAALDERLRLEGPGHDRQHDDPSGVDTWVRAFRMAHAVAPRPPAAPQRATGTWQVVAPDGHPLAEALSNAFRDGGPGDGVVVALPPAPDERHVGLLLNAAHTVLDHDGPCTLVLVEHGDGAAAFARSLHLEAPHVTVCVVVLPPDTPDAAEAAARVLAEARAATGYAEAIYDDDGTRHEPRLRVLPDAEASAPFPLGPDDVLLVTGGGKGITAACALALGRASGAALVLAGRSDPAADAEVADTLARADEQGLRTRYIVADVTDAGALREAVRGAESALGPVTAVLHGAARNVPRRLADLDEDALRATLAPKVQGLRHVLDAVDPDRLRLLVTFGSIIGRMGLPGEADYALANAWLVRETERWQAAHPHCRCLAVEWSVWSAVGMGARLGSLDALAARGVTPIPPDEGIAWLLRLLQHPLPSPAVIVTGRFGNPPTLRLDRPELPFLRFLEQPRRHVPGVELVVDARLSTDADPYLHDHVLQGEHVLPAVLGLEAMAQAAMAVTGSTAPPVFEHVTLPRPVVVPPGDALTIRLAALVRSPGTVEVVLRTAGTAFQADHFRATCRFGMADEPPHTPATPEAPVPALDPDRDLYGRILFHRGRFQRLRGYRMLRATACVADVDLDPGATWFGRYLPSDLVLGDPGARDATIHGIQPCIPHRTLIPVGVDRLVPAPADSVGPHTIHARERSRDGATFIYDVVRLDAEGRVVERWDGLRLQLVGTPRPAEGLAAPLLGPYLERRLHDLVPGTSVAVALLHDPAGDGETDRRARSDRAIGQALGVAAPVRRRPNGRPEVAGSPGVSAAHAGALTLAVAGNGPVGCDLEPVTHRDEALWRDLLGADRFDLARLVARESGTDLDVAATRVWTVLEGLTKAGTPPLAPLVLDAVTDAGWIRFTAGRFTAASVVTAPDVAGAPLALALVVSDAAADGLPAPDPAPATHTKAP